MIFRRITAVAITILLSTIARGIAQISPSENMPKDARTIVFSRSLTVGGSVLQVEIAGGHLDLPDTEIVSRVELAAHAVALYYGHFPVSKARILIIPVRGEEGVLQGTTWGNGESFRAFTRLRIGEHTRHNDLEADWVITHELVHMALSSLPDSQHWLEEGLATYVEPIARVQDAELRPEQVWGDMMRGLPQGEPASGDGGMDHTATWGRTYWGGALFCLLADIEIRKQTHNHYGLQDALQAIVRGGATIDTEWPIEHVFILGDQGTGTRVLETMYQQWRDAPVSIDLNLLWGQLGVRREDGQIIFDNHAPLALIRTSITAPRLVSDSTSSCLSGHLQSKREEKTVCM